MANKVVIDTTLNPAGVVRGTREIQKEIDATIKAQEKLDAKLEKFGRLGGNENSKAYKGMLYDAQLLEEKLEMLNEEMQASTNIDQMNADAMTSVGNATEQASESLEKVSTSVKKSNKDFKKMLTTILKYGFGIRSLYFLFRKLRTAISEGFKNLAQFNDGANYVNESLSSIMNALTKLKNSVASALAPLLSVVAPILNSFISMLQQAIEYVGIFFSALTGKSTYYKAKDVNDDYAKSLNGVASSAKNAKKQLAGFYDLNTLGKKDSGSGSGGYSATEAKDMFEEVSLAGNKVADFANRVKSYLSDLVNSDAFTKLKEKFTKLTDKIKEVASVGFEFIKGAWPSLSEGFLNVTGDICDSISGIITFIEGVFSGDWEKAWEGIKQTFNGICDAIDDTWSALMGGIADGLEAIGASDNVVEIFRALAKPTLEVADQAIEAMKNSRLKSGLSSTATSVSSIVSGAVKNYKIPQLATGTVVPRTSSAFMAMLGDNNEETEVVSPLSTMKQAFKEAMAEAGGMGGNTTVKVVLEGDANGLFQVLRTEEQSYYDRTGNLAFVH